jgi:Protein of unknown function (DUF3716)
MADNFDDDDVQELLNQQLGAGNNNDEDDAETEDSFSSSVRGMLGDADFSLRLPHNLLAMVHVDNTQILLVDHQRLFELIRVIPLSMNALRQRFVALYPNQQAQNLVLTSPGRLDGMIRPSTFEDPVGVHVLHPQRNQALWIQAFGVRNQELCERCARDGTDGPFLLCVSAAPFCGGACGNCLWHQNAIGCSGKSFFLFPVRC